jgi:CheY-like chemotaxis protein
VPDGNRDPADSRAIAAGEQTLPSAAGAAPRSGPAYRPLAEWAGDRVTLTGPRGATVHHNPDGGGAAGVRVEYRFLGGGGAPWRLELRATSDRAPDGQVERVPCEAPHGRAAGDDFANSLFDDCPLGLVLFAADGTLLKSNAPLRALFGLPSPTYSVGIYNILADPFSQALGIDQGFRRAAGGEVGRVNGQVIDFSIPENAWHTFQGEVRLDYDWVPLEDAAGTVRAVAVFVRGEQLPKSAEAARPVAALTPDPSRTILFVDDEPMIRRFAHTALTQKGYHVILAEDGEDALEKYARFAGRVALIILDLTMPRLTGVETFRELHRRHPEARVLFSSGYSDEPSDQGEGVVGFLPKPYRMHDLLDAVREALGTGADPNKASVEP